MLKTTKYFQLLKSKMFNAMTTNWNPEKSFIGMTYNLQKRRETKMLKAKHFEQTILARLKIFFLLPVDWISMGNKFSSNHNHLYISLSL